MKTRSKILMFGAIGLAVAAGGTSLAVAGSNGDSSGSTGKVAGSNAGAASAESNGSEDANENEAPISGSALDQASAKALAHLGEGTVTETEVGDEESYYEVEVTLDDGSETDVQLDRDFNVVGAEAEGSGPDDR